MLLVSQREEKAIRDKLNVTTHQCGVDANEAYG